MTQTGVPFSGTFLTAQAISGRGEQRISDLETVSNFVKFDSKSVLRFPLPLYIF